MNWKNTAAAQKTAKQLLQPLPRSFDFSLPLRRGQQFISGLQWFGHGVQKKAYISFVKASKSSRTSPDKRRKYDEAFKADAMRLANESRSMPVAAQLPGIDYFETHKTTS